MRLGCEWAIGRTEIILISYIKYGQRPLVFLHFVSIHYHRRRWRWQQIHRSPISLWIYPQFLDFVLLLMISFHWIFVASYTYWTLIWESKETPFHTHYAVSYCPPIHSSLFARRGNLVKYLPLGIFALVIPHPPTRTTVGEFLPCRGSRKSHVDPF